jgi:hypothetical protein
VFLGTDPEIPFAVAKSPGFYSHLDLVYLTAVRLLDLLALFNDRLMTLLS